MGAVTWVSVALVALCSEFAHSSSLPTRGRILSVLETPLTNNVSLSVPCSEALLSGGLFSSQSSSWCTLLAYNSTTGVVARLSSQQASGNIDPAFGAYFPADATIPSNAQLASQAGKALVRQSGWGGGPNVSLAPQPDGTLWGVHTTPYTGGTTTGVAVRLTWHMGSPLVDSPVVVPGPLVSTPSPAAFVPSGTSCTATATVKAMGAAMSQQVALSPVRCMRYRRVYTKANVAGRNYTSPVICHALLSGLAAGTSYSFSVQAAWTAQAGGAAVTFAPSPAYGGALPFTFSTPPAAGSRMAYPVRWGVMADVGQTYNSSLTAQYLRTYATQVGVSNAGRTGLDIVLNVGDFSYADNYGPASVAAPSYWAGVPGGTNQQRWDTWMAMWQPVIGAASLVSVAGNHEIESSGVDGMALTPTTSAITLGVNASNYPFQSYATRVPHGAQSPSLWGDIFGNQFYSQNLGPVHFVSLNTYLPFYPGTAQYSFFSADMAALNRTQTPWLVVAFHASAMHTYLVHYKELECFLSIYEPLFLRYRVDFIFQGHVHAYERTHPVYQYQRNTCGPVYVTIGDGGNIEGPYRNYVDDVVPGAPNGMTYCEAAWSTTMNGPPGYQSQVHPPGCPTVSYQAPSGVAGGPGALPDPTNSSVFYCQRSQPVWSAHRDPTFGFAGLTFINDTAASYAWYRSVDQQPGRALVSADTVTYTRWTGACQATTSTASVDVTEAAAPGPSPTPTSSEGLAQVPMPPPAPPPMNWVQNITSTGTGKVGVAFGIIFIFVVIGVGAWLYMRHRRATRADAANTDDGVQLLPRDAPEAWAKARPALPA